LQNHTRSARGIIAVPRRLRSASPAGLYRSTEFLAILRHPLMVVFLSLAALIQVYRVYGALPGRIHEEDFADYYAAATIMRQGQNPYHTSLVPVGVKLGLHTKANRQDQIIPETPIFLFLLKELGALPLTRAYWTWITINFAALLASF
jgi:hypothetical protein